MRDSELDILVEAVIYRLEIDGLLLEADAWVDGEEISDAAFLAVREVLGRLWPE